MNWKYDPPLAIPGPHTRAGLGGITLLSFDECLGREGRSIAPIFRSASTENHGSAV
jgi:hypothetical protein